MLLRFALFAFVILVCIPAVSHGQVPGWLSNAAASPVPAYGKTVDAVVLHDEQTVTLSNDGKLTTVESHAVKLLNAEGRRHAIARAYYLVSSGKVREIEAWLIRGVGGSKEFDKKTVLDVIADPDDVYNEGRLKVIDASREAQPGDVFGFTIISEDTPLFYQDIFRFQQRLPVLLARYRLSLPSGWTSTAQTFNSAPVTPQVTGSTYTWELRNLPPIPAEPMSPALTDIAPRIVINYAPPQGAAANLTFANWTDVSVWATSLYDPQLIVDPAITAKAQALTAGAKTEYDKIKAIGTFIQNLRYISIDIGVGHGNGYKPRPSTLMMNRGYGDCKDKANLMRAMLKSLGIEAYPIAIYSGDSNFVRVEWASPRQFNHCIIAVRISDSTVAHTVIDHKTLGRLLIFDATDQFTPVGDLPDYLQGSYGLIIAGDKGTLSKMPETPSAFNAWQRETEVSLAENGTIQGVIRERTTGQESRSARTMYRSLSQSDFSKAIENWLTRGATAARLEKITSTDRHADAAFDLDVEFSAPAYGQLMQNRLLVFKPTITSRTDSIYLTEKTRELPVSVNSNSFSELVTFSLPKGFSVDETPEPVNIETSFGKYVTSFEVKGEKLIFKREYITSRKTMPVADYDKIREFFTKMKNAEQGMVVLVRK